MHSNIAINKAVDLLKNKDNILIVTHKNPDGDAVGSTLALYYSLLMLNKNVIFNFGEKFPSAFNFIYSGYISPKGFKPAFIVSVDLADKKMLIDELKIYSDKIDLAIDHHASNPGYAKQTLLGENSPAATEVLYDVIVNLIGEENINSKIASCLYLGLSTDTGCFKYSSVRPKTHIVAAKLIEKGAEYYKINKLMFDTKSKKKLEIEQKVISNAEYFLDDKCVFLYLPLSLKNLFKASDEDLDGFSAISIQIEGVDIGITIRESSENEYRVSVRTSERYNASKICQNFGGGGHNRAAGFTAYGKLNDIKKELISYLLKIKKGEKNEFES